MSEPKYTIERHEHGLVVTGHVGLDEIPAVGKLAHDLGFDMVDALLTKNLKNGCIPNVLQVYGNQESLDRWRRSIGMEGRQR